MYSATCLNQVDFNAVMHYTVHRKQCKDKRNVTKVECFLCLKGSRSQPEGYGNEGANEK